MRRGPSSPVHDKGARPRPPAYRAHVLPLLLTPVLIGVSMLVQRPLSRALGIIGPVWPLVPFAPTVRWRDRLTIRGAGLLFTFALVLGGIFLQTSREQRFLPRVKVMEGLAADQAGVRTNDLITAVDGVPVDDFAAVRDQLLRGGTSSRLTLLREGVVLVKTVPLREGVLGVQPSGEQRDVARGEALQKAAWMLSALPVLYARSIAGMTQAAATPGPSKGPPLWLLTISLSLAFSWWLSLALEVGALGVGVMRDRTAVLRPRS